MTDSATATPDDRRREAARWRISAEWAVEIGSIPADADEDEMRAAAAAQRPGWCLPGMNERR